MAKTEVVMPQMGESITTGTITKWHKKVGDIIKLDETLLDISTDKVESEIPSPVEGKIIALLFTEGTTVDVGKVIAHIDDDLNAKTENVSAPSVETFKVENITSPKKSQNSSFPEESERRFYTPLVKKMAQEAVLAAKKRALNY